MKKETVVITGASAGIGRATAWEFAKRGARIGLLARGMTGLKRTKEEVEAMGGEAELLSVDLTDPNAVMRALAVTEARFGPVDIWINNAMATVYSPLSDLTPEEFKRATEVTYLGAVYGTMAALSRMRVRGYGTIVQVSSGVAFRGIPLQSPYSGAKFALRGFTDALRSELIHDKAGVHVTMVHLPGVNTPQFEWGKTHIPYQPQPIPPVFQPEVAAKAVYWAAHHRRRDVFVGASTYEVAIGNALAPGILDRYLARLGYTSQHTGERISPDREDNLFRPVEHDFGAHGPFDYRGTQRSPLLWLTIHRNAVLGFVILFLAFLARTVRKRRRARET